MRLGSVVRDFLLKQLAPAGLVPVGYRSSWWTNVIQEPFAGAWQRNLEQRYDSVASYNAVFACVTLIASDISKLRIMLVEQDGNGIWTETSSNAFNPVLRKPNAYQDRIKFLESWILSKLMRGNAYIYKIRDERQVVVELHVLEPTRCVPLVAPNGDVYYQIKSDNLIGLDIAYNDSLIVPATEIIHDRMNCLFHPLCGLSPLYAGGLAAQQGLSIQNNSNNFFANQSRPSGVLSAPGHIGDDTAERLRVQWTELTTGKNVGKLIVAGDDLKFHAMGLAPEESQLIEQLKWTAESICSVFRVPPWMVGVSAPPSYNNIEALNTAYYSQCLQILIESVELSLDEGLGLPSVRDRVLGTELDLDGLLRMDTPTLYDAINKGVGGGWLAPNEGRRRANYKPTEGGESPMMQQQNYSLAALAKRDAKEDPFKTTTPSQGTPPAADDQIDEEATAQMAAWEMRRALAA